MNSTGVYSVFALCFGDNIPLLSREQTSTLVARNPFATAIYRFYDIAECTSTFRLAIRAGCVIEEKIREMGVCPRRHIPQDVLVPASASLWVGPFPRKLSPGLRASAVCLITI